MLDRQIAALGTEGQRHGIIITGLALANPVCFKNIKDKTLLGCSCSLLFGWIIACAASARSLCIV